MGANLTSAEMSIKERLMNSSDIYYSGIITKLLKYNKSGFITDVFGRRQLSEEGN